MTNKRNTVSFSALLISVLFAFGFNNVITTATPSFTLSLGGTLVDAGVHTSLYILGGVLLRFAFGPLADRTSNRLCMLIGTGVFAVTTPFYLLVDSMPALLVLRLIQSVGLAAYLPCASALVSKLAPASKIGRWISVYRLATIASLILGPLFTFPLIEVCGYEGFFIALSVCALVALLFLLPIKEPITEGKKRGTARSTLAERFPSRLIPVFWITLIGALSYGLMLGFGKLFFEERMPHVDSGILFTLIGIGGLLVTSAYVYALDRFRINRMLVLPVFSLGLAYALFSVATDLVPLAIAGILCGIGYFGILTSAISEVSKRSPLSRRSTIVSTHQSTIDVGLMAGNAFFGILLSSGVSYAAIFIAVSVVLLGTGVTWILTRRVRPTD